MNSASTYNFNVPVERRGTTEAWRLRATGEPSGCTLVLQSPQGQRYEAQRHDLFRCLQDVRVQLEPEGVRVGCKGALRNAHPSPMASEAGAWVVYLMPRWRAATLLDLARIFDPVPVRRVVTVAEQEAYWLSLADSTLFGLVRLVNPVGWLYTALSRVSRRRNRRRLYEGGPETRPTEP